MEEIENESIQQWNRSAAIKWIIRQQGNDGGFGDIATTAEVALALSGSTIATTRRCAHSDHPLLDAHGTSNVNYLKIYVFNQTIINYTNIVLEPAEGVSRAASGAPRPFNESDTRNVSFTYTLWVGTNVTDNYTLFMVAPRLF